MNRFRITAFVLSSLVATASIAGAQASSTGVARTAQARHAKGPARGLLRGLNLSADEKTKLKEVNAKYRAEAKASREALKPTLLEARALRQKGDTAGARTLIQQAREGQQKTRALMVQQAGEMRAALSAENQKVFDANVQKVSRVRARQAKIVRGKLARRAAAVRKPNA
ncbi:MAG: Spy/CpxP family protein refolding chaperone [Gemmatimonadota bacterium]